MPPEEDPKNNGGNGDGGAGGGGGDRPAGGDDAAALKAALAKERARANTAEAALKSLQTNVNEGKTDAEKMASRMAELETQMREANLRAMRAEVGQEKGLTAKQAARLQGNTAEELAADADELLAAFAPAANGGGDGAAGGDANGGQQQQATGRQTAGRPQEKLRPGATPPADEGAEFNVKDFLAAVPRG